MSAAAYIRVSTEDQAAEDACGLDAQKESIEKYFTNNSFELGKIFQYTVSGALEEIIPPCQIGRDSMYGFDLSFNKIEDPCPNASILTLTPEIKADSDVSYGVHSESGLLPKTKARHGTAKLE
jgi:hypothetical protein